ncbi:MAG TPA: hypothetical protein VGF49_07525 [Candidatus Solibacter sp.]
MKALFRTANNRVTFEVDSPTAKELFAQLASIQEVFDAERKCGMPDCGSVDIRYATRERHGFEFFELQCQACRARFCYGQSRDGANLFPKRYGEQGALPNSGWSRYNAEEEK